MRLRHLSIALLACGLLAVPRAEAFNFRFLRDSVLGALTPEDIDIGTRATGVALDSGENGEWSNPATGASGFIRILGTVDVDERRGCRRTRMGVTAGGRSGSGTYIMCRNRSGAWNFYTPRPGATVTPAQPPDSDQANPT